jgi:hypothetical protein
MEGRKWNLPEKGVHSAPAPGLPPRTRLFSSSLLQEKRSDPNKKSLAPIRKLLAATIQIYIYVYWAISQLLFQKMN